MRLPCAKKDLNAAQKKEATAQENAEIMGQQAIAASNNAKSIQQNAKKDLNVET